MTGYQSKKTMAQDKLITGEEHMTKDLMNVMHQAIWDTATVVPNGDIRALKHRIHELEGELMGYKKIVVNQDALLERQTARIVDLLTHIENFDGEELWIKRINDAVLAEREACAAKAKQFVQHKNYIGIAAAIRARGTT
jgi:deoxyhypusine synthase